MPKRQTKSKKSSPLVAVTIVAAPKGIAIAWWQQVARVVAQTQKLHGEWQVSLVFVSAPKMKRLNRDYRGKDSVTDVLSFEDDNDFTPQSERSLGEIIICTSRAKAQAAEYHHSLKAELTRLWVHGLAHVCGYEHEAVSASVAKKMFKFERQVIEQLPISIAVEHTQEVKHA